MNDFEQYRIMNCQGMEVTTCILDNGYVQVTIPKARIDVTYNPMSTTSSTWPSNWFSPANAGRVFN
jgi:hypothetical protein